MTRICIDHNNPSVPGDGFRPCLSPESYPGLNDAVQAALGLEDAEVMPFRIAEIGVEAGLVVANRRWDTQIPTRRQGSEYILYVPVADDPDDARQGDLRVLTFIFTTPHGTLSQTRNWDIVQRDLVEHLRSYQVKPNVAAFWFHPVPADPHNLREQRWLPPSLINEPLIRLSPKLCWSAPNKPSDKPFSNLAECRKHLSDMLGPIEKEVIEFVERHVKDKPELFAKDDGPAQRFSKSDKPVQLHLLEPLSNERSESRLEIRIRFNTGYVKTKEGQRAKGGFVEEVKQTLFKMYCNRSKYEWCAALGWKLYVGDDEGSISTVDASVVYFEHPDGSIKPASRSEINPAGKFIPFGKNRKVNGNPYFGPQHRRA